MRRSIMLACVLSVSCSHAAVSGEHDAGDRVVTAGAHADEASGVGGQSSGGSSARAAGAGGCAADGGCGRQAVAGGKAGAAGVRAGSGGRASEAGKGGGHEVAAGSGGSAGMISAGNTAPPPGMRPYKGVANSPCAARTALNVSWYYNWEQSEHEACSDGSGGVFVPMIWGHAGDEQSDAGIRSAVASFVMHGYGEVLGFNEPDNKDQSNIPVMKALELWPAFDAAGIRVGSPGTAANADPGQKWFSDFMKRLNADKSLRADFLAIHWYGWNAGSCDAKASQLESYIKWAEGFAGDRSIWITEWGCLNQSAPDEATVVTFYKAAVDMFAKHPRIERYAWYPWSSHCDLNDEAGNFTELGKVYAAEPAYR